MMRSWRSYVIALCCVGTVTGATLLVRRAVIGERILPGHVIAEGRLARGKAFPAVSVVSDGGRVDIGRALRGHWTFVMRRLVLDPSALDYPQVVLAKHAGRPIQFLFLAAERAGFAQEPGGIASGIQVAFDDNPEAIPSPPEEWTAITDPSGVVRFIARFGISTEAIRQLAEQFLTGTIDYAPPAGSGRPQAGQAIPDVKLVRIADGQPASLREMAKPGGGIVFFQANCTYCEATSFVTALRQVDERFPMASRNVHPVFSKAFPEATLKTAVNGSSLASNLYMAATYIDSWEDAYYVGPGARQSPLYVPVTENGVLGNPIPYAEWINAQTGAGGRKK